MHFSCLSNMAEHSNFISQMRLQNYDGISRCLFIKLFTRYIELVSLEIAYSRSGFHWKKPHETIYMCTKPTIQYQTYISLNSLSNPFVLHFIFQSNSSTKFTVWRPVFSNGTVWRRHVYSNFIFHRSIIHNEAWKANTRAGAYHSVEYLLCKLHVFCIISANLNLLSV